MHKHISDLAFFPIYASKIKVKPKEQKDLKKEKYSNTVVIIIIFLKNIEKEKRNVF